MIPNAPRRSAAFSVKDHANRYPQIFRVTAWAADGGAISVNMTESRGRPHPDGLATLLRLQHGVVSREQLTALDMTPSAIRAQVSAGRWRQLHRGVYATFTGPLPFHARVWAALRRVGDTATLSHLTAAYLDGLAEEPGEAIHIAVEPFRRIRGDLDGIRLHHVERLTVIRQPVRMPPRTRIEETVLDLVADARRVEEVATWVTRACQRRLTTPERLAVALGARKKIRWRAAIEAMVADVSEGAHSPLEVEYLRRVERAHGLPPGVRNRRWVDLRVTWIDVDLDEFDIRVELDGRIGHEDEGRFRDRRRDNRSTVSGRATLRYGHADVFGDACNVAAELAAVLRARGWTGQARQCGRSCRALS